jgi:radical SAM superfamily enzyme YgiQ (UPF0313 family)
VLFAWPKVGSSELFNFLPLGIGYLSANLDPRHQKRFFDGVLSGAINEAILADLDEFAPDLVVISVWSFNFKEAFGLAKSIKEHSPGVKVFVGGPEPSGRVAQMLRDFPWADFSLVGEGEGPLNMLADLVVRGEDTTANLAAIPGMVFRDGEQIVAVPPEFGSIEDLAHCDYEFIRFGEYLDKGYNYGLHRKAKRTAPVLTTRGCPFNCSFCGARRINGRKVRTRKVESVLGEMKYLYDRYGVDGINIIDDNFTYHIDFAKAVCRGILDLSIAGVSLNCPNGVRMERLDDELLSLMRRAGWEWVFIAPESGSPATLKRMKKALSLPTVVEKVKMIQRSGLYVFGFFIIGYPGEREEDIKMTFTFARTAGFDAAVFTCFHPLPGTPIYEDMAAAGQLGRITASTDYYEVNYAPEGLTPVRLKRLRLLGMIGFHLSSPRRIWLALLYKPLKTKLVFLKKLIFS